MAGNNTTTDSCKSTLPHLQWTLRIVYSAIFVLGTLGNSVVCVAIAKRKHMRTSNNLFTCNLAFHDLFLVLIYVPTQMITMENCHTWVMGDFMCHLVYFILPLCQSASSGTLLAITADRYRAVVFPMKAKLSKAQVIWVLTIIWTASLVTALPLTFVTQTVSPFPGVSYCIEKWPKEEFYSIYWILIFAVQYVIPLSAIAVLAGIMSLHLKGNLARLMGNCHTTDVVKRTIKRRVKQTRKITKMLVALVVLYAVCMLPQHLVFTFWLTYGDLNDRSYKQHVYAAANIFPIANSALNPLAYGTLNKEFKGVFEGLLRWLCGTSNSWDFKESARRTFRSITKRVHRADQFAVQDGTGTKQESLTDGNGSSVKKERNELAGHSRQGANLPFTRVSKEVRHVAHVFDDRGSNMAGKDLQGRELRATATQENTGALPARVTSNAGYDVSVLDGELENITDAGEKELRSSPKTWRKLEVVTTASDSKSSTQGKRETDETVWTKRSLPPATSKGRKDAIPVTRDTETSENGFTSVPHQLCFNARYPALRNSPKAERYVEKNEITVFQDGDLTDSLRNHEESVETRI